MTKFIEPDAFANDDLVATYHATIARKARLIAMVRADLQNSLPTATRCELDYAATRIVDIMDR